MIPKAELDKAIEIAIKYGIGKMYLIGSSLKNEVTTIIKGTLKDMSTMAERGWTLKKRA